ncbi:MAG: hypothetical protein H7A46_23405 [Verrucomicrobiales bacterium]|nr:hypothetical protein [Verrucomicrobiales bacterium]
MAAMLPATLRSARPKQWPVLLLAPLPATRRAQGTLVSQRTVFAEAHQSTIETVRRMRDLDGQTVLATNRYVELATGLNRWDETQQGWVPAVPEFEQTEAGYFVARQMDPAHVRVQVYTEFFDAPEPDGQAVVLKRADAVTRAQRVWEPDLTDRELEFGATTRMIPGRAFAAGNEQPEVPVGMIAQTSGSGTARTVDLSSTQLLLPSNSGSHFSGGAATSQLSLRDCELYNGQISFQAATAINRTLTLNNNLSVLTLNLPERHRPQRFRPATRGYDGDGLCG